ncbi:OmpA family protein [Arcobacter roscoffensis]|uniref:OmpA family protein n=1 Tax=Arcobacter roscoffensis TaxID=2961520 RepID=A0ABY5E6Z8_9BACT|nr:OmpA family protein [Arcobacter roscoffensis]UTJ06536.1 OmpA family protein [Arcobacter roscoffensis]
MSFGTKIFSLLFILIALIVYTVASFDYNKVQDSSGQAISTNEKLIDFDTKVIINYIEEVKNKALKIKDELLKDSLDSKPQVELNKVDKIVENEQKIQDKLTVDDNMADEEAMQDNEDQVEESQENSQEEAKEQPVIEETLQEETLEEEQVPVLTSEEIQEQINAILKDNKIIFKRGSADIAKNSFSSVQKVSDILKEHENIKVEIAGHTDSRGRASLNLRISQDRANSVKKALGSLGISDNRLKAVGYGEKFPIAKDDKNGLSEINRRVEINIIGEN